MPKRVRQDETRELEVSSNEPIAFDLLPFSPQQASDVKGCLRELSADKHLNPEAVVDQYWREVLQSAKSAESELEFRVLDTAEASQLRVIQKLGRLKRIPGSDLPRDFEIVYPIVLGAVLRGYLDRSPQLEDVDAQWRALSRLSAQEVLESAEAAIKSGWLSHSLTGRPPSDAVDAYVVRLIEIYREISDRRISISRHPKLGHPRGPLVRFLRSCLSPTIFSVASNEGVATLVKRYRKGRKH
jgi:hypothetical protein